MIFRVERVTGEAGVNTALACGGSPVTERLTLSLNPLERMSAISTFKDSPAWAERAAGVGEIAKSGGMDELFPSWAISVADEENSLAVIQDKGIASQCGASPGEEKRHRNNRDREISVHEIK